MSKFEQAKNEALQTCGPDMPLGEDVSIDTKKAFDGAKNNLEKKMWSIDKVMGGVDKQFWKASDILRSEGKAGCERIAKALGGSYKGEISFDLPKVAPTQTAKAEVPNQWGQTAKLDLGNITKYAGGDRTRQEMARQGI